MKISRTAFLVLTGTISAAACNAAQPSPPPKAASAPPATATAAPEAATTAAAASGVEAAPVAATATATTTAAPLATVAPPPASTQTEVAQTTTAAAPPAPPPAATHHRDPSTRKPIGMDIGCAQSDATYDDTRTGCEDQSGEEADCGSQWNGYPSTENGVCPGPAIFRKRCFVYSTNFKPRVSQAAYQCEQEHKGRACNSCAPFACGHKALMNACPDHSADAACDQIADACSEMSKVTCRSYLSGMNDRGRQAMVSCLSADCSKGFGKCLMAMTGE